MRQTERLEIANGRKEKKNTTDVRTPQLPSVRHLQEIEWQRILRCSSIFIVSWFIVRLFVGIQLNFEHDWIMSHQTPGQTGTAVNDRIRRNTDSVRSFTGVYGFRNRQPGTLSCKRAIVVISFRWSSQMRIKRFLVTIMAKIDKPCLQRFQLEKRR